MSREHPDAGKTRGTGACTACGEPVLFKVTKRGLLSYNCDTKDGGCGSQQFSRTAESEKHFARLITKWNEPEQRRAYLGDEALPKKARKPADPDPVGDDDPPTDPPPVDAEEPVAAPVPVATVRPPRKRSPPIKPAANSGGRFFKRNWS